MKKINYIIAVITMVFNYTYSQQNLVINPSFEDYTVCPVSTAGEVNKAVGWDTCRASADYFNICASTSAVQVPRNYFGYQQPSSGNAYCGFWSYATASLYREIIIGKLTTPLTISQKYYISYKVSRADSNYVVGYSVNKLGAKFSKVKQSYVPINNSANFYSNVVITDTMNWITLFGSFIADSTYQYIMLGNFFTDANITSIHDGNGLGSYYYIDDICVSTDSTYASNYITDIKVELKENDFVIYPNSSNLFFTIKAEKEYLLEIINCQGTNVLFREKISDYNKNIDCHDWPSGVYLIIINNKVHKQVVIH